MVSSVNLPSVWKIIHTQTSTNPLQNFKNRKGGNTAQLIPWGQYYPGYQNQMKTTNKCP